MSVFRQNNVILNKYVTPKVMLINDVIQAVIANYSAKGVGYATEFGVSIGDFTSVARGYGDCDHIAIAVGCSSEILRTKNILDQFHVGAISHTSVSAQTESSRYFDITVRTAAFNRACNLQLFTRVEV